MTEQLINFETAKLAQEKGFDIRSEYFYTDLFGLCHLEGDGDFLFNSKGQHKYDCNGEFEVGNRYYVPTQSLLQKWLRETHKIEIAIQWFDNCYIKAVNKKPFKANTYKVEGFQNYEETFEIALSEALKLV